MNFVFPIRVQAHPGFSYNYILSTLSKNENIYVNIYNITATRSLQKAPGVAGLSVDLSTLIRINEM